jgi:hypothetical protein
MKVCWLARKNLLWIQAIASYAPAANDFFPPTSVHATHGRNPFIETCDLVGQLVGRKNERWFECIHENARFVNESDV